MLAASAILASATSACLTSTHTRARVRLHTYPIHAHTHTHTYIQVCIALDESGKYALEAISKDRNTRQQENVADLRLQTLDNASALEKKLR
jgi:hypothetical protein